MTKDPRQPQAGVTRTEQVLFKLCSKSFLRLWSYANPFKDDAHEFCDVLVVFDNYALIFFDREKSFKAPETAEAFSTAWDRWKRTAISKQIQTAHGAERYLRSGRTVYLDAKRERAFPLTLNTDKLTVHKIIVAHGVAEACKNFAPENVSGSLAITYDRDTTDRLGDWPFTISIDAARPVHVLDSSSLPILLNELDTIRDFTKYLDAKTDAIARLTGFAYCGEEDLLGHYLLNVDETNKHFIGTSDPSINAILIGEGSWEELKSRPQYEATKTANRSSYFWDKLIDRTCDNFLRGKLLGDSDLYGQRSAIHEMAREPRFMRRTLVDLMFDAIQAFPDDRSALSRHLRFLPSYDEGKGYVFLQLWVPAEFFKDEEEYRAKRQWILEIACAAAKNKMPQLHTIIGIGIEPPKLVRRIAEDFILLDCSDWPDERNREYERHNEGWNFFGTPNLRLHRSRTSEFVKPGIHRRNKPGRNGPCPCGSGRKFKVCHGR